MNILPTKSWHVRNRDNIEKVKRDEAKAAEEEKKQQSRSALAEQEARTKFLRNRARSKDGSIQFVGSEVVKVDGAAPNHVNFFSDLEKQTKKSNKDHAAERKTEQEDWEKKVGILVQLGQSVAQGQIKTLVDGKKVVLPDIDPDVKRKEAMDPLKVMRSYLGHSEVDRDRLQNKRKLDKPGDGRTTITETKDISSEKLKYQSNIPKSHHHHHHSSKKHKTEHCKRKKDHLKRKHKHKSSKRTLDIVAVSSSPDKSLERMRAERLQREQEERKRTTRLMSGEPADEKRPTGDTRITDAQDGRYNSQYHPHLSRQQRAAQGNNLRL